MKISDNNLSNSMEKLNRVQILEKWNKFMIQNQDTLVEKWKLVLDVNKPVKDLKNAAQCLEDYQIYIQKNYDNLPILFSTTMIPILRKLLVDFKLKYDPELNNNNASYVIQVDFNDPRMDTNNESLECLIEREFSKHLLFYNTQDETIRFNIVYKSNKSSLGSVVIYSYSHILELERKTDEYILTGKIII